MILEAMTGSSRAQAYLRPLGSFEELLWQMNRRSPLHASLSAHVDGLITVEQWRSALEQTRQRHPLWSAVIRGTADNRPCFQKMREPGIALRVIEGDFARRWQEEMALELSMPIDSENGPLVRAVLMHGDESCMLILSAHHSICDGMSLAFALRDVLQALSGVASTKLRLHSSQEESLDLRSQARRPRHNPSQPTAINTDSTVYRSKTSIVPRVSSLQFSEAFTELLLQCARREGTTIHSALLAASGIVARRSGRYADRDLHLCSTISNRALVGSPEDCGVFFSACDFPFAVQADVDVWDLARRAKEVVSAGQSREGVKAVLAAVDGIVQANRDSHSSGEQGARLFLFDVHVSNLGVVPIAVRYGPISLRQLWGPAVLIGFEGEQTLGICTLHGRLCLLHTSHSPLPCFLGQIESALTLACAS